MQALLDLRDIQCRYQGQVVVDALSLHIREGDLACLLGPSGCGKTTALRAIAGFEPVHAGEILLAGQTLSRPGFTLAPEKRRLGMVFQDYALFPHLSVAENVGFALRRESAGRRRETVTRMLRLVGLEELATRYPHELSGGQQQRVALARALAARPRAILMDEPFSNLDVDTRERLSLEVRDILKQAGITGLLVTHHQDEAFALGDQVGVMFEGRILQWDTPFNLYHEPADRFVADFIGQGVFIPGTLIGADSVETELGILRGNRAYPEPAGSRIDLLLRPDDIVPDPDGPLRARIVQKAFKGAETLYTLTLPSGTRLLSLFPSHLDHAIGDEVGIRPDVHHLVAFPA